MNKMPVPCCTLEVAEVVEATAIFPLINLYLIYIFIYLPKIWLRTVFNWPNLVKLVNGTRISAMEKVSSGKTGLPFQKFHFFRKFSS